jgi:hypothetical protein
VRFLDDESVQRVDHALQGLHADARADRFLDARNPVGDSFVVYQRQQPCLGTEPVCNQPSRVAGAPIATRVVPAIPRSTSSSTAAANMRSSESAVRSSWVRLGVTSLI